MRRRFVTALLISVVFIVAMRPLFRRELINGHDSLVYPPRLAQMYGVISEGTLPFVWAPDIGNGFGQPMFEFVPPLLNWIALPWLYVGNTLAVSIQLGLASLWFLSALAVYKLARTLDLTRFTAFCGVVLWLFTPYVSLDLFVRAAFAEAAALAICPVALFAVVNAMDRRGTAAAAFGSIAVAAIALGHSAVALLFIPSLIFIVGARGVAIANPRDAILSGLLVVAIGLELAAFFWMPALLEKGFVKTEAFRQSEWTWREHAIDPMQLLWSPWGHGYSMPGLQDGMSFALGPGLLCLAVVGLVLSMRRSSRVRRHETAALGALAAIGAWLATHLSEPLWSRLTLLQYFMYPWRALCLPALALPFLAMQALERAPRHVALVVMAVIVMSSLPHVEPKGYLTFPEGKYLPQKIAETGIGSPAFGEYEPKWVEVTPPYIDDELTALDAAIKYSVLSTTSVKREYQVECGSQTRIEARILYYPGWCVTLNGRTHDGVPSTTSGALIFSAPAGKSHITLELHDTRVRYRARLLSITALCLASLALVWRAIGGKCAESTIQGVLLVGTLVIGIFAVWVIFSASRADSTNGVGAHQAPAITLPTRSESLMRIGLARLYRRNDALGAVAVFRKLLVQSPNHYGGTFQLARALDKSGKSAEARSAWLDVLRLASECGDTATVSLAAVRLKRDR